MFAEDFSYKKLREDYKFTIPKTDNDVYKGANDIDGIGAAFKARDRAII